MPKLNLILFLPKPGLMFLAWGAITAVSAVASAETVEVGPRETIVEHRLTEGERIAEFVVERLCHGSNAPTVTSRFVIRYFDAASLGFVRDPDSNAVTWIGNDLRSVQQAYAQAGRALPGGTHDLSDPEAVRAAARAELALADKEPVDAFPTSGDPALARVFRVAVTGPGDRRTISLNGCYSVDDLKEIMRLRRAAAERLLTASGE
ncbi:MAG: hypothetical protein P1U65_17950 [Minwuia sp.]|nr:hypothetical protein [Minwuia sp.]